MTQLDPAAPTPLPVTHQRTLWLLEHADEVAAGIDRHLRRIDRGARQEARLWAGKVGLFGLTLAELIRREDEAMAAEGELWA